MIFREGGVSVAKFNSPGSRSDSRLYVRGRLGSPLEYMARWLRTTAARRGLLGSLWTAGAVREHAEHIHAQL